MIKAFDTPFNNHQIGKNHVSFELQNIVSWMRLLSTWLVKISHHVDQGITETGFIPKALLTVSAGGMGLFAYWEYVLEPGIDSLVWFEESMQGIDPRIRHLDSGNAMLPVGSLFRSALGQDLKDGGPSRSRETYDSKPHLCMATSWRAAVLSFVLPYRPSRISPGSPVTPLQTAGRRPPFRLVNNLSEPPIARISGRSKWLRKP